VEGTHSFKCALRDEETICMISNHNFNMLTNDIVL